MDGPLIYLMISTPPETEMYMAVILAKGLIYMLYTEGLTLDKTTWK